ncbi:phytoene/squalene synthase family protein [Terrimonas sp. NA20]|uniref:Phytoene/squalene synthase family protein n=1 Tax=Terrimonas ginsenosidimutans TaxID=2908004 RepID=A0ABS9KV99_9BACT|nr:phytoene/squalene synthase family protein [Terrimonas ginsenosidimutans]MCG2616251.1 phytoene/squalene synthase family protein [Terrimonas ginsenosidimutans]
MKKLFDQVSRQVSKDITRTYSTSFSLGILALSSSIRPAIYAIYGYVRLADEIVDSFHDYDKQVLLNRFEEQTWQALDEGISLNPVLQSFQETVSQFRIDRALIAQFLNSMRMDLSSIEYDADRYEEYILGSAEVVGLMCLHVFVEGNVSAYDALKPYAMKLGSAFQKVNFLRDLKDDYHVLGRIYFPDIKQGIFDNEIKSAIEEDIEKEFKEALTGIERLPACSKFGVYLAYKYYLSLFRKIKQTPAQRIMQERIRIPNSKKLSVMMRSYVRYKLAYL